MMDARLQRESDELAEEIATFAGYIREQHGDEQAQAFIERMMERLGEIQPTAGEWFSQLAEAHGRRRAEIEEAQR